MGDATAADFGGQLLHPGALAAQEALQCGGLLVDLAVDVAVVQAHKISPGWVRVVVSAWRRPSASRPTWASCATSACSRSWAWCRTWALRAPCPPCLLPA